MARHSSLESLLHAELCRDFFEESSAAMEPRIAVAELPRPASWILKVVQAGVLSQAEALEFQQLPCETVCRFQPVGGLSLEDLRRAILKGVELQGQVERALLKALSWLIHQGRHPFVLALPGQSQAMFWTGQNLLSIPCTVEAALLLTVSHQRRIPGSLNAPLSSIELARANAQLLEELSNFAYMCPIPLRLDQRRLDAVQGCKSHGYTASNVPIHLAWLQESELPELPLPRATFSDFTPEEVLSEQMAPLLWKEPHHQRQTRGCCLVSIHLCAVEQGKRRHWMPQPRPSLIYWVKAGVIVACEPLELPLSSVSCALFASARGLEEHAELQLGQSERRHERSQQLLEMFSGPLRQLQVNLEGGGPQQLRARFLGSLVLGSGALLTLAQPLTGLFMVGSGSLLLASAGSRRSQLERELQTDWKQLQGALPKAII